MNIAYCCIETWLLKNFSKYFELTDFSKLEDNKFDLFVMGPHGFKTLGEVGIMLNEVEWLIRIGMIKKIVYLSGYSVYKPKSGVYTEKDVKEPHSFMGLVNHIAEESLRFYSNKYSELKVVVFRLFNIYGPFQEKGYIVPDVIEEIINSNTVVRIGDLKKVRDFVYVDDLINALKIVNDRVEKSFSVYNIASSEPLSIRKLVERVIEISGKKELKIVFDPSKIRVEYDYDYAVGDNKKIEKELGWKPKYDIEEGLKLTYYWYLGKE